jgi:hypothetical protein
MPRRPQGDLFGELLVFVGRSVGIRCAQGIKQGAEKKGHTMRAQEFLGLINTTIELIEKGGFWAILFALVNSLPQVPRQ